MSQTDGFGVKLLLLVSLAVSDAVGATQPLAAVTTKA